MANSLSIQFWDVCASAPGYWRKIVYKHCTERASVITTLQDVALGDISQCSLDSVGFHRALADFQQQTRGQVLHITQLVGDVDILDTAYYATLAGVCEMWELGHFVKNFEAAKWFRLAAICEIASGDPSADWATSVSLALLDSFGGSLDSRHESEDLQQFPVTFCLITQALKGSRSARRKLESINATLAVEVQQELQVVPGGGGGALLLPGTGPEYQTSMEYLRHLVQTRQVDQIFSLADSSRSHDTNFEHQGSNILHWLVGLDLDVASDLCTTFFDLGAKLDLVASPLVGACVESWGVARFADDATPLCLAVCLGANNVFDRLLKLHLEHDIIILDFPKILELAIFLNYPTVVDGLLRARESHRSLCQSDSSLDCIDTALVAMVHHMAPIIRQEIHGISAPNCFEATLSVLSASGHNLTSVINALIERDQSAYLELVVSVRPWTDQDIHRMLHHCIAKDARNCFKHLLSTRPHLATSRFFPNYVPMFCVSATFSHGEYFLKVLYQTDSQVLHTNGPGWFLPLYFALVSDQLPCAKYITFLARSETQAQTPVDKILQHDRLEQEPLETVTRILYSIVKHWPDYRSEETVELFRWILDNCSKYPPYLVTRKLQLPFQGTVRARQPSRQGGRVAKVLQFETVFESVILWSKPLLETPFMGSAGDFKSLTSILRVLFDAYPQSREHVDSLGWTPLHYATWNGQPSTVRLLLDGGVDVNREVEQGHPLIKSCYENLAGRTALNLAICALYSKAPPLIIQGGIFEVRRWRARLYSIIHILLEHGARGGVIVTMQEMAFALRFAGLIRLSLVGMHRPIQDYTDSSFFGTWPAVLPNRPSPSLARAAFRSHSVLKSLLGQDVFSEDYLLSTPKRHRDVYDRDEVREWGRYALPYDRNAIHKLKIITTLLPLGWDVRLAEDGSFLYRKHRGRGVLDQESATPSPSSPVLTDWQNEPPPGMKESFTRFYREALTGESIETRMHALNLNSNYPRSLDGIFTPAGASDRGIDPWRPMQERQVTGRGAGLPRGAHMGPDNTAPTITTFSTHGDLENALDNQPLDGITLLINIEQINGVVRTPSDSWLFPKYSSVVAEALSSTVDMKEDQSA